MLDLTPLAHRSYLAEVERSAGLARAWSERARRAIREARRLFAAFGVRAPRGA